MDAEEMIAQLADAGSEAGSDYNDADDVDGWYGWRITDHPYQPGKLLTITYQPCQYDGTAGAAQETRWRLIPEDD